MKIILGILFFLLLIPGSGEVITGPWKLYKEKNGLKVYWRTNSQSPVYEIKVETEFNTTLGSPVCLVKDVSKQPQWAYSNVEAKILKKYSEFKWINYTLSDVPWPVTDRYVIAVVRLRQNADGSVLIASKDTCLFPDYKKEAIRIPFLRTSWYFKKQKSGKLFVRFQILLKMGGSVPSWVANLFVDKGPYNTVYNLKQIAETEEYRKRILPYIKE